MFSGGIEIEHCFKMGQTRIISNNTKLADTKEVSQTKIFLISVNST